MAAGGRGCRGNDDVIDLPLNFHPAAIRASAGLDLLPENWTVQN